MDDVQKQNLVEKLKKAREAALEKNLFKKKKDRETRLQKRCNLNIALNINEGINQKVLNEKNKGITIYQETQPKNNKTELGGKCLTEITEEILNTDKKESQPKEIKEQTEQLDVLKKNKHYTVKSREISNIENAIDLPSTSQQEVQKKNNRNGENKSKSKKKKQKRIPTDAYKQNRIKANARHRKYLSNMTAEKREKRNMKKGEAYRLKKENNLVKFIKDLTPREKQRKRKYWKTAAKKSRDKKKNLHSYPITIWYSHRKS